MPTEMEDLRQRHVRLLYRQRGSASRVIDYDVVIEPGAEPGAEPPAGELAPAATPEADMAADAAAELEEPLFVPEDQEGEEEESHVTTESGPGVVDTARFAPMSLSQLATPLTSMATIDVLRRLLEGVVQAQVGERTAQFQALGAGPRTARQKLCLKLEIKILEKFLSQCKQDLSTLSELNLSNNDLLYRLKQISLLKNSLSASLLEVRNMTEILEDPHSELKHEITQLHNIRQINQLISKQKTSTGSTLDPSQFSLLSSLRSLNDSLQVVNGAPQDTSR